MREVHNLRNGELTGTLMKISDGETVSVEYMKLDSSSEQRLLTILKAGNVTARSVQELFIEKLSIKSADVDKFRKGQSSWIQEGNKLSFTGHSINKTRFKGDMQGLTLIGDTCYAIEIKIGNIDFDISEQLGMVVGDMVVFENVSATIYPGQCSVRIIED